MADALHTDETGKTYFVQPLTENMAFRSFFDRLGKTAEVPLPVLTLTALLVPLVADDDNQEVHYLQSQNGNIYRSASDHPPDQSTDDSETPAPELALLQEHIKPAVEFMSNAIGMPSVRPSAET